MTAASAGGDRPGRDDGVERRRIGRLEWGIVAIVRTEPGDWSGWHHHAGHDTYFFVLQGGLEFEYGGDRATIAVAPGDFAHMPGNLIHRERTPPGEPVEAVVVRIGRGPAVVNVDDPTG